MPDLASVLKAEVARLARKELRAETDGLKKASARQRSEIAELKRHVRALEKQLKALSRHALRAGTAPPRDVHPAGADGAAADLRFRAAGMASNRHRLSLSAENFGRLVGASAQSVYSWEQGKSKPRARNLAAIAALRGIGKREAAKRLAALEPTA